MNSRRSVGINKNFLTDVAQPFRANAAVHLVRSVSFAHKLHVSVKYASVLHLLQGALGMGKIGLRPGGGVTAVA